MASVSAGDVSDDEPVAPISVEVGDGDPLVVTVAGDIDITSGDVLRAELQRGIDAHEPATLVVDLAAVDFIDSSGLAVLVSVAQRVPTVVLRNASTTLRRVVDATGLGVVLRLEP